MTRINSFIKLDLKKRKITVTLINKLEVQPKSKLNHN